MPLVVISAHRRDKLQQRPKGTQSESGQRGKDNGTDGMGVNPICDTEIARLTYALELSLSGLNCIERYHLLLKARYTAGTD
jgi:hypothetical protein